MAVMMGSLYAALREAGVPEPTAQRAAEEMAAVGDVAEIKGNVLQLKADVGGLKAGVASIKGMLGFDIAMTVSLVSKTFLGSH